MRFSWFWFLAGLFLPLAALALAPAELPPPDFPGRQYIDSKGCVFQRVNDGWSARLARDGSPTCGYPPSLSIRGADGRPKLQALDPDAGKTRAQILNEKLARTVLTNLQPGELVGDPQSPEVLPDMGPEHASTAPLDDLKAALRAAPAIRAEMSREIHPNLRLCRLLGHDSRAGGKDTRDPTQGFCAGLRTPDLSRLAFARPLGRAKSAPAVSSKPTASTAKPKAEAKAPPKQVPKVKSVPAVAKAIAENKKSTQAQSPAKVQPVKQPIAAQAKPAAAKEPPKEPEKAPAKPQAPAVPKGARHVQITSFKTSAEAAELARRVAMLGYPVLRARLAERGADTQILLAGPFASPDALSQALAKLRKAGFAQAVPR
ncbi:SPOR domain-containing protein [Paracoccus litorisediminis]|uniref:SPOR domain-containing protein n=1 Tax=Paracoccus litorisediminis TaxID=2006130 RepID=A0A844HK94_9RHOB|nr:SPOR domain-containing protein [Paracoccus litorisediminis]MTH58211.1 SPOR domain-containing protein [Paracoccus litorisediminis]